MANYFTLTKKGETESSKFNEIDDEMCAALNKKPDTVKYYLNWYDNIGFALACGKDWEWCKNEFKDWPEMIEVINWLEENYISNCWAGR